MRVSNVHERRLDASAERVGALVDALGSAHDRVWPTGEWPALRFDRPLQLGARGGHGPVRYSVEGYEPGRCVTFRFTAPAGFDGTHRFIVERDSGDSTRLRHILEMKARGPALISWPVVFRPLHDALLEDLMDRAELALGRAAGRPAEWSPYVKLLRALLRRPGGNRSTRVRSP